MAARVASPAMFRGRATARDQWHLTVQFLGNDADLAAVATTFELDPLDLGAGKIRLDGADALGPRRRGPSASAPSSRIFPAPRSRGSSSNVVATAARSASLPRNCTVRCH